MTETLVKRLHEAIFEGCGKRKLNALLRDAIAALSTPPAGEQDARRLALEEAFSAAMAACCKVSDGEVMSKHVSSATCLAARSAIAKCLDAINAAKRRALAAQPERKLIEEIRVDANGKAV